MNERSRVGYGLKSPQSRRREASFSIGLLVLWALFIFATSSLVISPQELFGWVNQNVAGSEAVFWRFQVFWVFSWFVIVKGWHAVEFALLFVLCLEVMNRFRGRYATGNILYSISICVAYAVSDELHQAYVPGRDGTIGDVMIDGIGVLIAGFWSHCKRMSVRTSHIQYSAAASSRRISA